MAAAALVWLAAAGLALAPALADPDVDRYNVRVGSRTFAGLYWFIYNQHAVGRDCRAHLA